MEKIHDLIIIGAGPAGLCASIYASRYGISHKIIGSVLGGQITETHEIDNYPGLENMTGVEFSMKWGEHAKKYGVEILATKVDSIMKKEGVFILALSNEETIRARAILLATGTHRRKLAIAGEKHLLGMGVSYCATCDGFFYKDKVTGVIGGADSAASAALYLSNICKKVYLIYRGAELRAEPYWTDKIKKTENIEVIYNTNVVEIFGEEKLEKVELDKEFKGECELELDGLFIEAGSEPNIDYAKGLELETDEKGYIKIKKDCTTSVLGAWAAGDITDGSDGFQQVITAAAEGAIAVRSIFRYLKDENCEK